MKKNIFLLGSTGSIGKSALDVIKEHPEHFSVEVLVTNVNVSLLLKQIEEFKPEYAVVYNEQAFFTHKSDFELTNTKVLFGYKGLEVIEAYWLYQVNINQIEVVVHPQSIIHSMVEFEDGSIKAQLGLPDMKIPILYALNHPKRLNLNLESINFADIKNLTFEQPDFEKFKCLKLAYQAIEKGNTYPAVMNAANEIAVAAFLKEQILFTRIPEIIEIVLNKHKDQPANSVENLVETDKWARETAISFLN